MSNIDLIVLARRLACALPGLEKPISAEGRIFTGAVAEDLAGLSEEGLTVVKREVGMDIRNSDLLKKVIDNTLKARKRING